MTPTAAARRTASTRPAVEAAARSPATLALTLGAPAAFGTFTPGVAKTYTASTTANVISSAADAALSVSDPSANEPGYLVNGTFSLPSALKATATSAGGTAAAGGATSGSPLTLLTYSRRVSNDAVTVAFAQDDRGDRRAAHGRVREDAHVHAEHHDAVGAGHPRRRSDAARGRALQNPVRRVGGGCRLRPDTLAWVSEDGGRRRREIRRRCPGATERRSDELFLIGAITLSGLYLLVLIPLTPALVGSHPVVLELLKGSMSAMITMGAMARVGDASLAVAVLAAIPG